jgi:hypothetical protein
MQPVQTMPPPQSQVGDGVGVVGAPAAAPQMAALLNPGRGRRRRTKQGGNFLTWEGASSGSLLDKDRDLLFGMDESMDSHHVSLTPSMENATPVRASEPPTEDWDGRAGMDRRADSDELNAGELVDLMLVEIGERGLLRRGIIDNE